MQVPAPQLLALIGRSDLGLGAEIVAEGEMAGDFRRTIGVKMKLDQAPSRLRIGPRAIAPPGQAELPRQS